MNLSTYLQMEQPQIPLLKYLFYSFPPAVILDIGACEGEDSMRYKQLFPEASVIAFEPVPQNLEKMRSNFQQFSQGIIHVAPVALARGNGNMSMYISSGQPSIDPANTEWDYGNKSSSLLKPSKLMSKFNNWLNFKSIIDVPTRSLDSYLREINIDSVDFMHIDVQGAEMMVFEGSMHTLKSVSCIWVEVGTHELYQGQPSANETQTFLESIGFLRIMECLNQGSGDHLYVNPMRLQCSKI